MTTKMHDLDFARLRNSAANVAQMAAARGWPIPKEHTHARALQREAMRARTELQPAPLTEPTDPARIVAWIRQAALVRITQQESVAVASDLADQYELAAIRGLLTQVHDYIGLLVAEFDKHGTEFARLVTEAPMQITGNTPAKQLAQHTEMLRAAEGLTACAVDRERLAHVVGEGDDFGANKVWMVLDPTDDATIATVGGLLGEFAGRLPSTAAEWQKVAASGLGMAPLDGVPQRTGRYSEAVHNSGWLSPDGGQLDKSIGVALALSGNPQPPAIAS